MDRIDEARGRLFAVLRSRGIPAFKYQNAYEDFDSDWHSVAVVDPSILSNPPDGGPRPTSMVTNTRGNARRADEPGERRQPWITGHRQTAANPTYKSRGGRGNVGRWP